MRDPHDLHPLTCAGMALNTHEVHHEQAELLLGAAGAAAAGFPAACAAKRSVGGWCLRAGGPRATKTWLASVDDPGVYEHLHSTKQIVV